MLTAAAAVMAAAETGAGAGRVRETVPVSEHRAAEIAANRSLWAIVNERYTDAAAEGMWRRAEMAWGLFAVPEEELGVLGDVEGLDVLDLACGTGYVAAWLAR